MQRRFPAFEFGLLEGSPRDPTAVTLVEIRMIEPEAIGLGDQGSCEMDGFVHGLHPDARIHHGGQIGFTVIV